MDNFNTQVQAASFSIPSFEWTTDIFDMAMGFIDGGVGVLPDDSMTAFCKGNATEIYP
jgi:hypothetical protein